MQNNLAPEKRKTVFHIDFSCIPTHSELVMAATKITKILLAFRCKYLQCAIKFFHMRYFPKVFIYTMHHKEWTPHVTLAISKIFPVFIQNNLVKILTYL